MTPHTRTRHSAGAAVYIIVATITIGILYAVLLVAPSGTGFLTSGGQTKNSMASLSANRHSNNKIKHELTKQQEQLRDAREQVDDIAIIVFRKSRAKSGIERDNEGHVKRHDKITSSTTGSSGTSNHAATRHGLGRGSAPPHSGDALRGNGMMSQLLGTAENNTTIMYGGPHNKVLPIRLKGLRDLVFSDELIDFDFVGVGGDEDSTSSTPRDRSVKEQITPTRREHSIRRGLHLREYERDVGILSNLSIATDVLDSKKEPDDPLSASFSLATSAVVRRSKSRRTRRPLSHVVAMVITDGKFEDRIDGLLGIDKNKLGRNEVGAEEETNPSRTGEGKEDEFGREGESGWLRGTFHTFLMFDLQQSKSWEVFKHRYGAASIRDGRGDDAFGGALSLPPSLVGQPRTKRRPIGISKEDFTALLGSNRNEGEREEKSDKNHPMANADSIVDDDQLVSLEKSFHSQIGIIPIPLPLPSQRHQEGQNEAVEEKKKFTFSLSLLLRPYTTEFISAAPNHRKPPNAAWKPWSVVLFMARRGTQRFLREKAELYAANEKEGASGWPLSSSIGATTTPKPLWFAILDDDTFAFSYSLAYTLEPLTRELDLHHRTELTLSHDGLTSANAEETDAVLNETAKPSPSPQLSASLPTPLPPPLFIYAGHVIDYCPRVPCNPKKRFPFAFGGSGIFLSRDAVLALASPDVVGECRNVFMMIAGDEQLGGCIAKSQKIRQLHTENSKIMEFSLQKEKESEKLLISGLNSTSRTLEHVMDCYRRERKHYGFVATDVFRGAAYDIPATAIGHYYLHQKTIHEKKPEKTGGKHQQPAAASTFITASSITSEDNAIPPFPVSFHHMKNQNEIKFLAAVEKAWETVVWETFSGEGRKGENSEIPGVIPNLSQSVRNRIPSITPWPFIAAILLADEELLNASLTLARPPLSRASSGSPRNPHGLPLLVQTTSGKESHHPSANANSSPTTTLTLSAASMQMLRSLMDFADKNRYFVAYNRRERLYPYYVVPELIQQRLEAEAAARRSSSKKKGRRR